MFKKMLVVVALVGAMSNVFAGSTVSACKIYPSALARTKGTGSEQCKSVTTTKKCEEVAKGKPARVFIGCSCGTSCGANSSYQDVN